MIAVDERRLHEEVWLLLPWLANGRLAPVDRERAEQNVRQCKACEQELQVQLMMCRGFTEPDRVVYAPGPSFRKLMDRIESRERKATRAAPQPKRPSSFVSLTARLGHVSLWRPPGLAWAASFLLFFGITGMMVTAYRWSQPVYTTHTDSSVVNPDVLHIALDRSLPIGEVEELLQAGGARIVEGPGSTGVLGVMPAGIVPGKTPPAQVNDQLRVLSARLRADPRVLWVQPLADDVREH